MDHRSIREFLSPESVELRADDHWPTQPPTLEEADLLRAYAAHLKDARRFRRDIFGEDMFGEPAWEMLLSLYVVDKDVRRLSVGQLTRAGHAPQTTNLRWINFLEEQELVRRTKTIHDHRVALVELTHHGRNLMDRYFRRARAAGLVHTRSS